MENIKCGGCMKSIKEALLKIAGVQRVDVYKEEDKVSVLGTGVNRSKIVNKLALLGYPEKGNNSLLHKAKSFFSCASGKMS